MPSHSVSSGRKPNPAQRDSGLARFGLALATWSERWFPDPLVFALAGIVIVFIFGWCLHESASKLAIQGAKNFWTLVPFTMQMVMIIIGGYVVATTPVVNRLIRALAGIPKSGRGAIAMIALFSMQMVMIIIGGYVVATTPVVNRFIRALAGIPKSGRGAIAMIALFSMLTSLISWGLSLIFSGLLARELARRVKDMDYRAAGAAAYLGLGAVWALGLSSSAAMMMATKGSIPPALFTISGLIPLRQSLFLWQSIARAVVLIVVSVAVAYFSAPSPENAKTAADFGIEYESVDRPLEKRTKPGEWLEYSPLLTVFVSALILWYLIDFFRTSPQGALAALDLNTYNLMFLAAGLLLHWRPKRFVRAVADSVPATGGVLIQFPFYAVILGMIVGTGISTWLANLFARITTQTTYPLLVALYSAILGTFVPSGGSKWVIEAPYICLL